jgi:hypothetical protein
MAPSSNAADQKLPRTALIELVIGTMAGSYDVGPVLPRCSVRFEARLGSEAYATGERTRIVDWIRAAVATLYAAGMTYAGGLKFLLQSAIFYAPGTLLFLLAKRKEPTFRPFEAIIFAVITITISAGAYALAVGAIST